MANNSQNNLKFSIVVPIYNDGYLADALCKEIDIVFKDYLATNDLSPILELIFVNDGSKNDSLITLLNLSKSYNFLKIIDLSRNFGQHSAIACGFKESNGEIVVRMNVDMQDPPAVLPKLIRILENEDCDLVVGQYEQRNSPLTNKVTSYMFFQLFRFMTGLDVPHNTSPMRVMNRKFINAYNLLTEKSRFPQGLDIWLGYKHKYVSISHQKRVDDKSSYSFAARLSLAVVGILYFSDRPIKFVAYLGFLTALLGIILGIYIIFGKLLGNDYLPGFATLASLGLIAFGLQVGSLGLVGLYIGKIFTEVQNRPIYLIRKIY